MASALNPPAIKLVGSNGQISLGKQYAGRHVLVEESEPGVWIVRTATVIPDNERWLHESLPRQPCRLRWPGPPLTHQRMPIWMKP